MSEEKLPEYRYNCDNCTVYCPSMDSGRKLPCSDLPYAEARSLSRSEMVMRINNER